jgi:hypothetical protein
MMNLHVKAENFYSEWLWSSQWWPCTGKVQRIETILYFSLNPIANLICVNHFNMFECWYMLSYTVQVTRYTRLRYPRFRISAVLFQCHGDHQYLIRGHGRSCRAVPLSCARSFTDSSRHFDSADHRLRPVMVHHSENQRTCFPFYAFSVYAAISRNATPAYNESHLYI